MAKKVFVSGCYDMLHSGHVAFFEEAATLGDLYVGLGSDEIRAATEEYKDKAYGWKFSGCGGGGYWILISDQKIPNAIKEVPCYGNI